MAGLAETGFSKVAQAIATITQKQATGELQLSQGDRSWQVAFWRGRLLWASDRQQRVRRWCRLVKQFGIAHVPESLPRESPLWEVLWLGAAIEAGGVTAERARSAVRAAALEVIFAATARPGVVCQWRSQTWSGASEQLLMEITDLEALLQEVQKLHQRWKSLDLRFEWGDQALKLIAQAPTGEPPSNESTTHLSLSPLLNGKRSIWDVAILMRQPVAITAHIIHHLVQQDQIAFVPLPDLPLSVLSPLVEKPAPPPVAAPLVACIDDSPNVCRLMEQIVTGAGLRFLAISDSIAALPKVIEQKPDLIFLDLIMPIVSGYEVCSQIRRVNDLKDIPIVILTGNDGAIDRVRSKVAGASEFMGKPIQSEKILAILRKYFQSHFANSSRPAAGNSPPPSNTPSKAKSSAAPIQALLA